MLINEKERKKENKNMALTTLFCILFAVVWRLKTTLHRLSLVEAWMINY